MVDNVNHPPHYNTMDGVEVIDIIEHYFPDNHHLANCTKYLLRSGYKGEQVQDIKKMIWFAERWLWLQENKKVEYDLNDSFTCSTCNCRTDLVDSKNCCSDCHVVTPAELVGAGSKVILPIIAESGLEGYTEGLTETPKEVYLPAAPEQITLYAEHTKRQNVEMDRREAYRAEYRHQAHKFIPNEDQRKALEGMVEYEKEHELDRV